MSSYFDSIFSKLPKCKYIKIKVSPFQVVFLSQKRCYLRNLQFILSLFMHKIKWYLITVFKVGLYNCSKKVQKWTSHEIAHSNHGILVALWIEDTILLGKFGKIIFWKI